MHSTRFTAISLALVSCMIVGCSAEPTPTDTNTTSSVPTDETPVTVDRTNRESTAAGILEAFAQNDWAALASFASPMGVRFTPYTHVNDQTDRVLSPADVASFGDDANVYVWGTQEGSGEPIAMTNAEYLVRYMWDHDYRTAEETIWNAPQNHGSMIDNVQDVYPGASTVEYHFPGFDEQYGGMDWRSLRLVLAQGDDGNWVLHGVIHDEWTP